MCSSDLNAGAADMFETGGNGPEERWEAERRGGETPQVNLGQGNTLDVGPAITPASAVATVGGGGLYRNLRWHQTWPRAGGPIELAAEVGIAHSASD